MANEMITLKAKANQLGVPGYRKMTKQELLAAIKSAQGKGSAPAKGKSNTSSNGRAKGKTAGTVKGKTSPAKGKGKTAPAKSTGRKSSPAKGKAATGTAKRQSAAKPKTTARSRKSLPARANIDRTQIDWKAESNVGKSGKRKDVMDGLRKFKGNYDKVFDLLKPNAKRYYKGKTKAEAEGMLRWLINRVAYDFVMATEQHTPGERAAYGTSDKPQDIARREKRAAARPKQRKQTRGKTARKPAGARASAAKGKTQGKGKGKTRR